jgi:hypothetical protein
MGSEVMLVFQNGRSEIFADEAQAWVKVRRLIAYTDVVWVDLCFLDGSVVKIRKEF